MLHSFRSLASSSCLVIFRLSWSGRSAVSSFPPSSCFLLQLLLEGGVFSNQFDVKTLLLRHFWPLSCECFSFSQDDLLQFIFHNFFFSSLKSCWHLNTIESPTELKTLWVHPPSFSVSPSQQRLGWTRFGSFDFSDLHIQRFLEHFSVFFFFSFLSNSSLVVAASSDVAPAPSFPSFLSSSPRPVRPSAGNFRFLACRRAGLWLCRSLEVQCGYYSYRGCVFNLEHRVHFSAPEVGACWKTYLSNRNSSINILISAVLNIYSCFKYIFLLACSCPLSMTLTQAHKHTVEYQTPPSTEKETSRGGGKDRRHPGTPSVALRRAESMMSL